MKNTMVGNVILKKDPKIEFQLLDNGFQLIDEQTTKNSGFYEYGDLQAIELNKLWFPKLAKWLRPFTWILNGAPLFPDAESTKAASVIIRFKNMNVGVWLTDSYMTEKAKMLKNLLERKSQLNHS